MKIQIKPNGNQWRAILLAPGTGTGKGSEEQPFVLGSGFYVRQDAVDWCKENWPDVTDIELFGNEVIKTDFMKDAVQKIAAIRAVGNGVVSLLTSDEQVQLAKAQDKLQEAAKIFERIIDQAGK